MLSSRPADLVRRGDALSTAALRMTEPGESAEPFLSPGGLGFRFGGSSSCRVLLVVIVPFCSLPSCIPPNGTTKAGNTHFPGSLADLRLEKKTENRRKPLGTQTWLGPDRLSICHSTASRVSSSTVFFWRPFSSAHLQAPSPLRGVWGGQKLL